MRVLLIISILLSSAADAWTQAPIVLHGQTNWKDDLDMSLNVFEWKDLSGHPDNFSSINSKPFSPLMETRDRYSKRPQIRQWVRFELRNVHPSDTLDLILNLGA